MAVQIKKHVSKAIQFEMLEQDLTQEIVSERAELNNGNLWRVINSGTVKVTNLSEVCNVLGCQLIIRSKDGQTEYLLNDVESPQ